MFAESKVFQLGNIAENLCKKVTKLKVQVTPSTPPKVLEERRKEATEVAKKIEHVDTICAKAVKYVSQMWESLIDDKDLDEIIEVLRTIETKVNQLKNEMKKLSLVEKMAKSIDVKRIQQQVATLQEQ